MYKCNTHVNWTIAVKILINSCRSANKLLVDSLMLKVRQLHENLYSDEHVEIKLTGARNTNRVIQSTHKSKEGHLSVILDMNNTAIKLISRLVLIQIPHEG
jgi:hypothetical protein